MGGHAHLILPPIAIESLKLLLSGSNGSKNCDWSAFSVIERRRCPITFQVLTFSKHFPLALSQKYTRFTASFILHANSKLVERATWKERGTCFQKVTFKVLVSAVRTGFSRLDGRHGFLSWGCTILSVGCQIQTWLSARHAPSVGKGSPAGPGSVSAWTSVLSRQNYSS